MKKTTAILLLFIHLLNFAGYSLFFQYLILRSEARVVQAIDSRTYDKQQLTLLKTPIRLPYYNGSPRFERVEGKIEINGKHYTYIERKVSQDTLYLVCLLNPEKTALSKTKNDYVKESSGQPASSKKDNAPVKKSGQSPEYPAPGPSFSLSLCVASVQTNRIHFPVLLPSGFQPIPFSPPDQA